jgi:hypothetical protein
MENRKYTATAYALMIVIMTLMFASSCSPAAPGIIEESEDEQTPAGEEVEQIEEAIEEEYIEVVDYENAKAGAELYGYIPSYLCTDTDNYVSIEVTNTSDFTWRADGPNSVRLSYHYFGQDVDYVEYDSNIRTVLPENLEPGGTATVDVLINDIENPGKYVIQIDLVLEGYYWFSSREVQMIEGNVYFNSCMDQR